MTHGLPFLRPRRTAQRRRSTESSGLFLEWAIKGHECGRLLAQRHRLTIACRRPLIAYARASLRLSAAPDAQR